MRTARPLTALAVAKLRHTGGPSARVVATGGVPGLLLQVAPGGSKSWLHRYTFNGKRKHRGLGTFPSVSLDEARQAAMRDRLLLAEGRDPLAEKHATRVRRVVTFEEATNTWLAAKRIEFAKNPKNPRDMETWLRRYAFPHLADMDVAAIEVRDVLRVLNADDLWTTKTATAGRVRAIMEGVLDAAKVEGHRSGDNPAVWRGNLEAVLPAPRRITKRVPRDAVAVADAPAFWTALRAREGMDATALAFLTLTATRSAETVGARWKEVEGDVLVIPASRMKGGVEHRVPLSGAALAILQELPRNGDLIFPGATGPGLRKIMPELKFKDPATKKVAQVHGLRSTFKTWSTENSYSSEIVEICLSHKVGNEVERAYRRSDLLQQRRKIMQDYAAYLGA